jgi:predicted transcriptional regulator
VTYALDEKGHKVVNALENPKYNWRTIDGISQETGIDPSQVAMILKALPNIVDVVQSSVPDKLGRPLFTTRNHYDKSQNILNRILSTFSDRIR